MNAGSPRLALKVDVDTFRGTREGVPALVHALKRAGAGATFLFSVGPDNTGRALRRVFRRGFLQKVSRTSVVSHYGVRTLLYGTLLPGPHIGHSCADEMRAVADAGFEVGLHSYDHVKWQDFVARRDEAWTEREMRAGIEAFRDVFGEAPRVHGAAGWQMNAAAFGFEQRAFEYASDTRGTHPFLPRVNDGVASCAQIPTTLPTLDELIGVDGRTAAQAADQLLELTHEPKTHVFTLHAELEGMKLLPTLERLIAGWRAQGYTLSSLRDVFAGLDCNALPAHTVVMASVPGRAGTLACQGPLTAA